MIARFSLYGFLKNQRYFEPFIILYFLDQGLSFTQIGLLVAFRELCINAFEVPSGALADLTGRRRCMMLSFAAYIVAFLIFGLAQSFWQLMAAMLFFALGEAFRTGTHKAMIFTWLRLQGRTDEKTRVYGYTRSWSKLGSSFSIILATAFVLISNDYTSVFFYSIIPYALGLINFMSYPKELDGNNAQAGTNIRHHLADALRTAVTQRPLRRLIAESMGFEGMFKAAQDYLQPVLKTAALALPVFVYLPETRRSALVVGAVYLILYLASAFASRRAYRLAAKAGGEENGARILWLATCTIYAALIPLLLLEYYPLAIAAFIALFLLQNYWRPIQISRFDAHSNEAQGATILSIESQSKAVATMILAPLIGLAVDTAGGRFWPVGLAGTLIGLAILLRRKRFKD